MFLLKYHDHGVNSPSRPVSDTIITSHKLFNKIQVSLAELIRIIIKMLIKTKIETDFGNLICDAKLVEGNQRILLE